MVVVFLTVVAVGGATGVYFAGEAQHRRDRADIVRWEARALPAARDAEARQRMLRGAMPAREIAETSVALQRDIDAIAAPPLPEIVRPAAAAYVEAIMKTAVSLQVVGSASFGRAQSQARAAFAAAAAAEQTLVCRARLPACSRP